jgi:hypothetical protein
MWWRKRDEKTAPAFQLESGDRVHAILACEPVRFPRSMKTTLFAFYAIVRSGGLAEVVSVMQTIRRGRTVARHVQTKKGISPERIEQELATVTGGFTNIIEEASGHRLVWHRLDLADVPDGTEQVRRIREWGRVDVL